MPSNHKQFPQLKFFPERLFKSLGQFSFSELRGPGGGVINPTGPGVVPVPGAALLMGTERPWRLWRLAPAPSRDFGRGVTRPRGNVLHC